jgi:HEAT repeat protein
MVAEGDRAVSFLKERLPPADGNPERIRQLIRDLDHQRFAVREKATRELERLGPVAEPALRNALQKTHSPEVRTRVTAILARQKATTPLAGSAEELRTVRSVQVLEYIGSAGARDVLQSLAGGAERARITQEARAALKRLSRPPVAP